MMEQSFAAAAVAVVVAGGDVRAAADWDGQMDCSSGSEERGG